MTEDTAEQCARVQDKMINKFNMVKVVNMVKAVNMVNKLNKLKIKSDDCFIAKPITTHCALC